MKHFPPLIALLLAPLALLHAAEPALVEFNVKLETVLKHDDNQFHWFHPRAAAIPASGQAGPAVVMTIQKHLITSDYYSGLHVMMRPSSSASWTGPILPAELDWRPQSDGVTISVADVTPGWHAPTGKLLAIGCQVRYSPKGQQLNDVKRAHQTAYAVFDPKTERWSSWQVLELPPEEQFDFARNGCGQWLVQPDGKLLVPLYIGRNSKEPFSATVVECRFDGTKLSYIRHGTVLRLNVVRGYDEPSLIAFHGRYFLTLRNDLRGYVSVSDDGLQFAEPKPWLFDDGTELGSYNTQQHWLAHSDGLFLVYTRRGANNDHIMRHRAPLFMAQVNPETLRVVRSTEKIVVPERGAELGNFGCNPVSEGESWVTVSEGMFMKDSRQRGAEGATFVARILWSTPNKLMTIAAPATTKLRIVTLGDSITKGVRPGVKADETFAARLEAGLRADGVEASVVNVGIGGERTDQALRRLAKDVLEQKPSLVTIMYGTNDSYVDKGKNASRITVDDYRTNLAQLVDELRAAGITPVLMTEPRWGKAASLNGLGEHPNVPLENYVAACRAVATAKRTLLVDHYQHWTDAEARGIDIGAWTTDQCHPNPEGHRVLADLMLPTIRTALTK